MEIVPRGFVAAMEVQSTLLGKIREAQKDDKEIAEIKERMSKGKAKGFREDEHDTLWFEDRVYVPNDPEIRKLILQEAHDSPYSIHPENTKMYLVQSTLLGKIREAQKDDKEIVEIKERMNEGKPKVFVSMSMTPYGSRTVFMCPIMQRSGS